MDAHRGLMASVIRFSLRFRGAVAGAALLFLIYGVYAVTRAKYDVFPEFAAPQVTIQAESPGLSPEEVETLVTQPVENAVNGVTGIESIRSNSIQGLSVIAVTFKTGSDIYLDRQLVAERLASVASELPRGVRPPEITPLTSSTSVVLTIGLTSRRLSLMDLRTVADWTIKPRLLAVPGVAKVAVFGGDVRQIQVRVRPERLMKWGLSTDDVLAAARRATGAVGAGFIDNSNQRLALAAEGQAITARDIGRTVVFEKDGAAVTLSDVADVADGPEPPIGAASVMGLPGVQLAVSEQFRANTLDVTGNIEKVLSSMHPALEKEGISVYPDIFRPADFIRTATGNVRSSLIAGAALVVVVLFLFLFNLRTAAISATAIPLSLLAALVVLEYEGYSINTMVLGGLAIAVGIVVDDAIIDVENILRRLRENGNLEKPRPIAPVIFDASLEVRGAVVYATLAMILVFIPVITMSGVAGRLFAPLGVAYILATLASLLVALLVVPALCMLLLGPAAAGKEPPLMRLLKRAYRRVLLKVETHPAAITAAAVIFTAGSLSLIPLLGSQFIPELREGHYIVHMSAVPGTSLDESLRIGKRVTGEIMKLPFVRMVAQRAGRAEKGDDVYGTHYSEIDVDLRPLTGEEAERAEGELRKTLAGFPGLDFSFETPLTERIEETFSGYTAPVVLNIYGSDLDTLDALARKAAGVLRSVPGAGEVVQQSPPGTPEIRIRPRAAELARWGFRPVDVLDAIHAAFEGGAAGQVHEGNRVFAVSVVLSPEDRADVSRIGELILRNPGGVYVKLKDLADIYETSGRYTVLHEGAQRVQTITCNVAGRSVASFVDEAKKDLASKISFPPGTYPEFTGVASAQARSKRDLAVYSLLAVAGVVLLLSMIVGNARNLALVLLNLPFAASGGIIAVFLTGRVLSIGSLIGFVTLFGITLRNSIMMISHFERLVDMEGYIWGKDAALKGAADRLAPILMTALVTALGLLPLAMGAGTAGLEIEGPMAIAILGGLATSTALNLLVLPTLALRFGRFEKKAEETV